MQFLPIAGGSSINVAGEGQIQGFGLVKIRF